MTRTFTLIAAVVAVVLVVAYVVVTVTDHDGTALLAVLIGYLGGAGTPAVSSAVSSSSGSGK